MSISQKMTIREAPSNLHILRGKTPVLHSVLVHLLNQRLEVLNHLRLPIGTTVIVLHCLGVLYRSKQLTSLEPFSLQAKRAFVRGRKFFDLPLDLKLRACFGQSSLLLGYVDLVELALVSSLGLLDDIRLHMVYLKGAHLLESTQVLRTETDELAEGSALPLAELRTLVAPVAFCDVAELFGSGFHLRLIDVYYFMRTFYRFSEDLVLINDADLIVLDSWPGLQ